ncbi:ABC-type transport system involved in multi-copper enzyme maturation, permease component [Paenibacillus sp. UNCCL117]|uniref:ABC transporter permease subunit n=1 Tax=unclassified Paenibacillus TaxID=185978 RepID=UPI0008857E29|nr:MULTISPECIES: ABC transporter permease subunit [unclassified Paenibacillus]SDC94122.1 ABC-type transport system involved in multi-copper enzyme maturation, permease component [Paenibacillus sp. cl123]SFW29736.1 ABC-type transport system involved in multi-copper enzyme maturation, permease component [Paenibacillus sp. UNCCL117]
MTMYISATFKELTRKRVFLVTIILTFVFLLLFAVGVHELAGITEGYEDSPAQRLLNGMVLLVLGLFFAQFLAAFFVLFSAMGIVTGEQENGLLLAVAARPISRWKLYVAKWLGHAVWITVYSTILFVSLVWTIHSFAGLPLTLGDLLRGFVLFIWMPLLLLSLTMLGSVYLPMLGNGICAALLYGFALFTGLLEGVSIYEGTHPALQKFALLIGLLLPTDSVYRRSLYEVLGGADWAGLATSDMGPFSMPSIPSNAYLLYTVAYAAVLLWLGCRAFSRKDL